APASGYSERFAQGASRARFRHAAGGRQPPAQAVHADGKDDVEAVVGWREGLDAPDGRGDEGNGGWRDAAGRDDAALGFRSLGRNCYKAMTSAVQKSVRPERPLSAIRGLLGTWAPARRRR